MELPTAEGRVVSEADPRHLQVLVAEDLARAGAVHGVSFTLREGELLGFAGMVGAGRSETARLIFGADRRSRGHIKVAGVKAACRSPRDAMASGIALLPEDRHAEGAILDFSIRHNLTLPTLERNRVRPHVPIPSPQSEQRETTALIDGLLIAAARDNQDLRELSGGNQQKVVIGKWMAHNAKGSDLRRADTRGRCRRQGRDLRRDGAARQRG